MRKDMAQVIIERPRVGGGPSKGRGPRDIEDLPSRESMRKRHKDRKSLNENLAPLKRYLISKIGKHWDKIHSDVCQHLKLTSAVQKHVLDHLYWMVKMDCFIGPDGKVWERGYGYGSEDRPISRGFNEFYVHPKSKVLCYHQRKKNWWRKKKEENPNLKIISDVLQLHRIDDVWYEIHLDALPPYVETNRQTGFGTRTDTSWDGLYDTLLRQYLGRPRLSLSMRRVRDRLRDKYGREDVRCVKKVQCSKKMLKKWGIK